jgi:ABC-type Zn uptake system ZnuABC Zn-binding protein ZnuA
MRRHRLAVAALCLLALAFPSLSVAAPLRVLASFLPMYLFTVNVVGDAPGVTVDLMLPATLGCPHDYALTPGDMRKIASAELFIANGLGMEEFLGAPVRKANPGIRVVETAAAVPPVREEGAGHGGVNPHAWVSPKSAILQVRAIERVLSESSPANAPRFRANADAYASRLAALSAEYESAAGGFRRRNIVTFHNVFGYLARDYGLRVVGEVETVPGQEPSAGEIRKLATVIREKGVPALFVGPDSPPRVAEMIAREAGVPVRVLDPVATGSTAPAAYEEAMRRNLATLAEALSRP